MRQETATRLADVVLVGAAGVALWFILRDARRRRFAFGLLGGFIRGPMAGFLSRELRTAWEESGQRSMMAR